MTSSLTTIPDVGHLMELALGQGEAGVEALERLVALQERVMQRAAEAALSDALNAFQSDCPQIPQSSTAKIATRKGTPYSFTYADLPEIDRTIRPHLRAHGLSYSFDSTDDAGRITVTCTIRHRDGASVSATFSGPTDSASGASAIQKVGAAHTYAKRQALSSALGLITTNADADDLLPAEPITEEQWATLMEYVDAVDIDVARFLAWLGVSDLAELPSTEYDRALAALKAKTKAQAT